MGTDLEVAFFFLIWCQNSRIYKKSTKMSYPETRHRLQPSINVTRVQR